jgi:dTDP-4-amino-4,6-dideoxy-D-galactose acyltransferase
VKRSVRPEAETAAAALLDWDSEFWGAPIGRVEGGALNREGLHAVDEWAATHGVACVYFLADSSDASSAHIAEDGGFRLMDLRVELRRPIAGDETARELRPASPDDVSALRAIARASHGVTRFYADPHFPDDRCDDLYDTWITRSLEGWADGVLVAEAEGRPVGYVSCHLDPAAGAGSIGLIAVDEAARGGGIGVMLSRGAVAWCRDRGAREMSVVTQGRNAGALRTFQRAGFLVDSVGLWFHKWYRPWTS